MLNEQEDDQLMHIYRNTTTNFAQGASTPPHSDTGRYTHFPSLPLHLL